MQLDIVKSADQIMVPDSGEPMQVLKVQTKIQMRAQRQMVMQALVAGRNDCAQT